MLKKFELDFGQPICIRYENNELQTNKLVDEKLILNLLENFTENSIYAVQAEINSGFLTIKGGHRIGISGTCIFEDGKIKNIRYISSLNIRVAHEIKGCGTNIVHELHFLEI